MEKKSKTTTKNKEKLSLKVSPKKAQLTDSELLDVINLIEDIKLEDSKSEGQNENKKTSITKQILSEDNEKKFEKFLLNIYSKPKHQNVNLDELRLLAEEIRIQYESDEIEFVEKLTKSQNESKYWHKLRTGRITASIFKSVCRTNIDNPSITTIKKICWPKSVKFECQAVAYGRRHERTAFEEFCEFMQVNHKNFNCRTSGLIIHKDYPFFGASPDGLCTCDCCGESCLEIKCPYTLKDGDGIEKLLKMKDPYLIQVGDHYELSPKHSYYFQVQMQIFICDVEFCNFFIWSENECLCLKIVKDLDFWDENSKIAIEFSKKVLLPELLGQYYTRPSRTLVVREAKLKASTSK